MNQNSDVDVLTAIGLTAVNTTGALVGVFVWADVRLLGLLALVCFIDFITGVMASHKMEEDVTSKRWKVGLFSKVSLLLTLYITGLVLRTYHEQVANYIVYFFIWMFTMAELYSAWSNTYTIRTGERVKEQDVVALTIDKYKAVISALWGTNEGGTKRKD